MNIYRFIFILFLIVLNCRTYNVKLVDTFDESKVEKISVPRKVRASFFVGEEDLSIYCKNNKMVFVKFFSNSPREVWCEVNKENSKEIGTEKSREVSTSDQ